ncbi:MAG TPA: DUF1570 domain-containing protein [Vicinamibacterales bacterium]|nr:DUF1570 domain-containing protein [Vicinamibacterales bacterium]
MPSRFLVATAAALAVLPVASTADAAGRPWRLIRGSHITVVGQQSPGTLRQIAVGLEQFRAAVGTAISGAGQPPPMPTIVYAFDDRAALEPYLPLYHGRPSALAGYCHCGSATNVNTIAVSLASYSDSASIVYHEYTHVLVRNAAGGLPVWLNEGLAEFYSSFALVDHGRRAEVGRPLEHHLLLLRQRFIPVAQLLAVNAASDLYNEATRRSVFYAEAWALTHYLLVERAGGVGAVNAYIEAIAGGAAPDRAFVDAFGVPPQQMDAVLQQYVRRPVLRAAAIPLAARVEVDEPDRARTLPAAEAEARLGGIQLGVQRLAEAAPRIEAAAAAAPGIAEAQLALGLLRVQQDRMDDAWAPLERAAALAPDDFTTQYTFALMRLRHDMNAPERHRPSIEQARAALGRAAAVNPESADALAWQAFADLLVDDHLDEAEAAIRRAVRMSPGRLDFRVREAEVLLRRRQDDGARSILERVAAAAAIDPDAARQAAALLASLQERDRRAVEGLRAQTASAAPPEEAGDDAPSLANEPAPRHIVLRAVRAGEERAYGELTAIQCNASGVRFVVRVGSRTIAATAPGLDAVQTISYSAGTPLELACGPRVPADIVFLTWRPGGAPPAESIGRAIALEFVPRDYVP